MTENIDEYVKAWDNRLEQEKKKRNKRLQEARSAAIRCSRLLKKRFKVDEVYLVGSSQNQNHFHKHSDLDLAVKGLSPEKYYQALSRCWDQAPVGLAVDLIPLEDLSETEKQSLLSNSRELSHE